MKYLSFVCTALLLAVASPLAAQDIVSTVETGCAPEIENFCSQVSPGEGRLLACFYAHEDKLSGQCQYALYTASAQLEHAVSSLNYVAGQCENDIETLCANVTEIGQGQLLQCLDSQKESVSEPCKAAIASVFE